MWLCCRVNAFSLNRAACTPFRNNQQPPLVFWRGYSLQMAFISSHRHYLQKWWITLAYLKEEKANVMSLCLCKTVWLSVCFPSISLSQTCECQNSPRPKTVISHSCYDPGLAELLGPHGLIHTHIKCDLVQSQALPMSSVCVFSVWSMLWEAWIAATQSPRRQEDVPFRCLELFLAVSVLLKAHYNPGCYSLWDIWQWPCKASLAAGGVSSSPLTSMREPSYLTLEKHLEKFLLWDAWVPWPASLA